MDLVCRYLPMLAQCLMLLCMLPVVRADVGLETGQELKMDVEQVRLWRVGWQAVWDNDLEQLRQVLREGFDVNDRDTAGISLLHYALMWGKDDALAHLLIDHGAEVDTWSAVALGDVALISQLIKDDKASIEMTVGGATPLHMAAARGNIEIMKVLLDAGAELEPRDKIVRLTPLHYAVSSGKADAVRFLIARGADVNVQAKVGITPLHGAATAEVAAALIEAGADPLAKTEGGDTPLSGATRGGQTDVFTFLLSLDMPKEVLLHALSEAIIGRAKQDIVEELLKHDLELNRGNAVGHTPLHLAAVMGDAWTAEALLRAGADPNVRAIDQTTPLHHAVHEASIPVIKVLLRHGASPDARNDKDLTPIDWARLDGRRDIVELLQSTRDPI